MTSLRDAVGKPAIVRETAEQVGTIDFFVVDAASQKVGMLAISAGRATRLVEWAQVTTLGPDAVIIDGSREPNIAGSCRGVVGTLNAWTIAKTKQRDSVEMS